jgi:amino-acid N-acetyltransferase
VAIGDVRAVLQYVPLFRGRTFVVVFDEGLLPEPAVAETLLDLQALQTIGVQLVIGVLGGEVDELANRATELEIKFAPVAAIPGEAGCVEGCREILGRGQAVLVDCRGKRSFDPEVFGLAGALRAAKLISLVNGAGVLRDGTPLHAVAVAEAKLLAAEGAVDGAALLAGAAAACESGIPRVHVLDGRMQGVLADELFSNEGVGTMVHTDAYEEIRVLREEDVPELLAMIGRSVRAAHLIPRSYEEIVKLATNFLVLSVDDNVVGCVAVHPYGTSAEIACLYVKQSHEKLGYGAKLVQAAETLAAKRGIQRVFALTNRASGFFSRALGYELVDAANLPEERLQRLVQSGRESTVLEKRLDGAR